MKRIISLLLCCLMLTGILPQAHAASDTFTLMIYLCGTDLESNSGAATADLQEIVNSRIPQNGDVTVYVQTGGTRSWHVRGMTDRKVERWTVSQKGLRLVDSVGSASMGDAETFMDFLDYGFENFPADRYGLIMWDHGSGASGGLCYDEMTKDPLYYPEIYEGLEAGMPRNTKFAFIGFDACLMSSYELANHIAPFADYMIASEELEPGSGWKYDGWLPTLVSNPSISIPRLGQKIVDSFIQSASSSYYRGDYATLAVSDLSKLPALRKAVEKMGASLTAQIENGGYSSVMRLRQNMRSFGEISNSASDMIDLTVFADAYAQFDKTSAKAIKTALEDVIVYSRHTNNLSGVTGMSILVPYATRSKLSTYLPHYETLNLSPNYAAFVNAMAEQMSYGSTGSLFGNIGIGQQSIQGAQIDWFSQYANDQESYYENAGSLWGDLYGQTQPATEDFTLDSFLSALFGLPSTGGFNTGYDDSAASLWGQTEDTSTLDSFVNDILGSPTPEQEVTVETEQGSMELSNPFAGIDSEYAYTLQLTEEQLDSLGKVEANLMMNVSDPDFECYVELGYVQDVIVNWNTGHIYGLFDGTWATLDGQMVCMYDQIANERYVRSLIPVTVNGRETYLLVIFDDETPGGRVVGYTEGYTDEGVPARGVTELKPGDEVMPVYALLYWDEDGNQCEEPFEGDPITVGSSCTIPFEFAAVERNADYIYSFCLTDIYGDSTFSDFISISF